MAMIETAYRSRAMIDNVAAHADVNLHELLAIRSPSARRVFTVVETRHNG